MSIDIISPDDEPEVFLANIAARAQLLEGTEGVRLILLMIFRFPNIKNKFLAQMTNIAVPTLAAVRGELQKAKLLVDRTHFSEIGSVWIREKLGFRFSGEVITSVEKSLEKNLLTKPIHEKLSHVIRNRPEPDFSLDQSRATLSTVLKRISLLAVDGNLEGRKILLLGDDDALSLAILLASPTCSVTVVDIDERITAFLKKEATEHHIEDRLTIHSHDLKEPLPNKLQKTFDIFFTDPPYTLEGLKLFVRRGLESLTPILGKQGYICYGPKPPQNNWKIQQYLLSTGLLIKNIEPIFNKYRGARIIGQFSHLYHAQVVHPHLAPPLPLYSGKLYTSEMTIKKESSSNEIQSATHLPGGFHILAEFNGMSASLLNNPAELEKTLIEAAQRENLTVVDTFKHLYYPEGVTVIVIVEESHISIHTWPDYEMASVDVYVCTTSQAAANIVSFLEREWAPQSVERLTVTRARTKPESFKR